MTTDMWHGDVIAGMSSYDELDRELVDSELSAYCPARKYEMSDDRDPGGAWSADDGEEFAAQYLKRLREVPDRPDAEVRRDVLRAFMLDSLVPMTIDAQVSDGVATLTGTVAAKCERQDAIYLAGLVPGVCGVIDALTGPQLASSDHGDEAADTVAKSSVATALWRTAIPDIAELTIDEPRPGTVVLSGALRSSSDHDLAIATAWSVAAVAAVDDCIHVEA